MQIIEEMLQLQAPIHHLHEHAHINNANGNYFSQRMLLYAGKLDFSLDLCLSQLNTFSKCLFASRYDHLARKIRLN